MVKQTICVAALLALLMTGCSTASVKDYDRGPTSEDQFGRESAGCEMEAHKSTSGISGGTLRYHDQFNSVLDACMRSKGYSKK